MSSPAQACFVKGFNRPSGAPQKNRQVEDDDLTSLRFPLTGCGQGLLEPTAKYLEEGEVTKLRPSLAVGDLASVWATTVHCRGFTPPLA